MDKRRRTFAIVLGAAALIAPVAAVSANHVRIDGSPPVVTAPPAVVVPAPAQTLQVSEIEAGVVRANIIYANRIKADEVRGAVHQSRDVKVKNAEGKVKAPEVAASVIYVREMKQH